MDREQAEELRGVLERVPQEVSNKYSSSFWPYAPGSTAYNEATDIDKDMVNTLLDQTEGALESAGQHFTALHCTMDPSGITVIPSYTIARTILEACARSVWLLDPEKDTIDRFSRSIALLIQERRGEVRIERAKNSDGSKESLEKVKESEKKWEGERDRILSKARKLGIPLTIGETGSVNKVGDYAVESDTITIVRDSVGSEEEYRVWSSLEHQRFYRQRDMTTVPIPIPGTQWTARRRNMTDDQYRGIIRSVIQCYGIATWRSFFYSGYDMEWLSSALNAAAKVVGLPQCFWESISQSQS